MSRYVGLSIQREDGTPVGAGGRGGIQDEEEDCDMLTRYTTDRYSLLGKHRDLHEKVYLRGTWSTDDFKCWLSLTSDFRDTLLRALEGTQVSTKEAASLKRSNTILSPFVLAVARRRQKERQDKANYRRALITEYARSQKKKKTHQPPDSSRMLPLTPQPPPLSLVDAPAEGEEGSADSFSPCSPLLARRRPEDFNTNAAPFLSLPTSPSQNGVVERTTADSSPKRQAPNCSPSSSFPTAGGYAKEDIEVDLADNSLEDWIARLNCCTDWVVAVPADNSIPLKRTRENIDNFLRWHLLVPITSTAKPSSWAYKALMAAERLKATYIAQHSLQESSAASHRFVGRYTEDEERAPTTSSGTSRYRGNLSIDVGFGGQLLGAINAEEAVDRVRNSLVSERQWVRGGGPTTASGDRAERGDEASSPSFFGKILNRGERKQTATNGQQKAGNASKACNDEPENENEIDNKISMYANLNSVGNSATSLTAVGTKQGGEHLTKRANKKDKKGKSPSGNNRFSSNTTHDDDNDDKNNAPALDSETGVGTATRDSIAFWVSQHEEAGRIRQESMASIDGGGFADNNDVCDYRRRREATEAGGSGMGGFASFHGLGMARQASDQTTPRRPQRNNDINNPSKNTPQNRVGTFTRTDTRNNNITRASTMTSNTDVVENNLDTSVTRGSASSSTSIRSRASTLSSRIFSFTSPAAKQQERKRKEVVEMEKMLKFVDRQRNRYVSAMSPSRCGIEVYIRGEDGILHGPGSRVGAGIVTSRVGHSTSRGTAETTTVLHSSSPRPTAPTSSSPPQARARSSASVASAYPYEGELRLFGEGWGRDIERNRIPIIKIEQIRLSTFLSPPSLRRFNSANHNKANNNTNTSRRRQSGSGEEYEDEDDDDDEDGGDDDDFPLVDMLMSGKGGKDADFDDCGDDGSPTITVLLVAKSFFVSSPIRLGSASYFGLRFDTSPRALLFISEIDSSGRLLQYLTDEIVNIMNTWVYYDLTPPILPPPIPTTTTTTTTANANTEKDSKTRQLLPTAVVDTVADMQDGGVRTTGSDRGKGIRSESPPSSQPGEEEEEGEGEGKEEATEVANQTNTPSSLSEEIIVKTEKDEAETSTDKAMATEKVVEGMADDDNNNSSKNTNANNDSSWMSGVAVAGGVDEATSLPLPPPRDPEEATAAIVERHALNGSDSVAVRTPPSSSLLGRTDDGVSPSALSISVGASTISLTPGRRRTTTTKTTPTPNKASQPSAAATSIGSVTPTQQQLPRPRVKSPLSSSVSSPLKKKGKQKHNGAEEGCVSDLPNSEPFVNNEQIAVRMSHLDEKSSAHCSGGSNDINISSTHHGHFDEDNHGGMSAATLSAKPVATIATILGPSKKKTISVALEETDTGANGQHSYRDRGPPPHGRDARPSSSCGDSLPNSSFITVDVGRDGNIIMAGEKRHHHAPSTSVHASLSTFDARGVGAGGRSGGGGVARGPNEEAPSWLQRFRRDDGHLKMMGLGTRVRAASAAPAVYGRAGGGSHTSRGHHQQHDLHRGGDIVVGDEDDPYSFYSPRGLSKSLSTLSAKSSSHVSSPLFSPRGQPYSTQEYNPAEKKKSGMADVKTPLFNRSFGGLPSAASSSSFVRFSGAEGGAATTASQYKRHQSFPAAEPSTTRTPPPATEQLHLTTTMTTAVAPLRTVNAAKEEDSGNCSPPSLLTSNVVSHDKSDDTLSARQHLPLEHDTQIIDGCTTQANTFC